MTITNNTNRIAVADSFRCIAILAVILYHFYSYGLSPASGKNLYPYGYSADYFTCGNSGVEFFFIISGFVIAYTLGPGISFAGFWKKRFIRLFPGMLVCSLITYLIFCIADTEFIFPASHSLKNLLFSLTFISPEALHKAFPNADFNAAYINGSYWSLWPEIQFYLLASILYCIRPQKFFASFFITGLCLYLLTKVIDNIHGNNTFHISPNLFVVKGFVRFAEIFNICLYIPWFMMGVLFFQLYSETHKRWAGPALVCIALCQLHDYKHWQLQVITLGMLALFSAFVFFPKLLNFLNQKIITSVGVASYSLYLIHENIGVLLIHKYAGLFGSYAYLFPVPLIFLFIAFSILFYTRIEKPFGNYLRQKFL